MDPTLGVALLALAGSIATAAMTYRASTRATDVNERANQLQWVKELRDAHGAAERQVDGLRTQVATLSRELTVVSREAEQLITEMQLWRRTAWREGMTIERYREFIGPPPPPPALNGRAG